MPTKRDTDRKCHLCGGFFRPSGCERENVKECTCEAKDMPYGRCCKAPTSAHMTAPAPSCCAECGKRDGDGWALYCVDCMTTIAPALAPAPQPARALAAVREPLSDAIKDMLFDTRETFDADGSETPQVVRDVIEYVASWLQVYTDKSRGAQAQQEGK